MLLLQPTILLTEIKPELCVTNRWRSIDCNNTGSNFEAAGIYQCEMAAHVEEWISMHPEFDRAFQSAVQRPAFLPTDINYAGLV